MHTIFGRKKEFRKERKYNFCCIKGITFVCNKNKRKQRIKFGFDIEKTLPLKFNLKLKFCDDLFHKTFHWLYTNDNND